MVGEIPIRKIIIDRPSLDLTHLGIMNCKLSIHLEKVESTSRVYTKFTQANAKDEGLDKLPEVAEA